MTTLEESLKMERDPFVAPENLPSDTARIRRILRTQDWWTVTDIPPLIGQPVNEKSTTLVHATRQSMEKLGWKFNTQQPERQQGQGAGFNARLYLCVNPEFQPTAADCERIRQEQRDKKSNMKVRAARAAAAEAKRERDRERKARQREAAAAKAAEKESALVPGNGHSPVPSNGKHADGFALMSQLPTLTEEVQVRGLALNDDGTISMMLRGGGGRSWAVDVLGATIVEG